MIVFCDVSPAPLGSLVRLVDRTNHPAKQKRRWCCGGFRNTRTLKTERFEFCIVFFDSLIIKAVIDSSMTQNCMINNTIQLHKSITLELPCNNVNLATSVWNQHHKENGTTTRKRERERTRQSPLLLYQRCNITREGNTIQPHTHTHTHYFKSNG